MEDTWETLKVVNGTERKNMLISASSKHTICQLNLYCIDINDRNLYGKIRVIPFREGS